MDLPKVNQLYADQVVEAIETRMLETFRNEQAAPGQPNSKVVPNIFPTNDDPVSEMSQRGMEVNEQDGKEFEITNTEQQARLWC